jgi:hypothetical protein
MKVLGLLIACAFAFALPSKAAFSQNESACRRAQFNEQITQRFPNARDACLDVISRDGQDYAVFRAQFERAVGNTLLVRFKSPDGSRGPLTRIPTEAGFRVLVDGEEKRVNQLARNQELTAYVQVDRPMVALAPAQTDVTLQLVPLVIVPAAEQEDASAPSEERVARTDEELSMPNTAGIAPTFGVLGLVLIVVAVCATSVRRLRAAHHDRLLRLP